MRYLLFVLLSMFIISCSQIPTEKEKSYRYKVWDKGSVTYYTDSITMTDENISFISQRDCSCGDSAFYRYTLTPPYQIRDKRLDQIIFNTYPQKDVEEVKDKKQEGLLNSFD